MILLKQFQNSEERNKATFWFGFVVFWIIAGFFLSERYGFYCNLTDSFPQNYFIVKKQFNEQDLNLGAIITARVDFKNPYVEIGKKLVKQVTCPSGSVLETRGLEYFCNGYLIATALVKDSQGNEIKQFHFTGTVPDNMLFVTGENPKSYDSRYFGFIAKDKVVEVGLWRF